MNTSTILTSIFLQQSLTDSQSDYARTLSNRNHPYFNVIALTASNEHQAEAFRAQLAVRELPVNTEFVVIPDKNGERVGSGGATLSVIKYVKEKYGSFKGLNIAVLHSGGDGKRTPSYSALGKIFSPVPRVLPNGKTSTLFDEFMIAIASVPGRMREGMLLLSGDVLLLFNPLQIDYSGNGAAAISFKESAETGKEHGVFLRGTDGCVERFLHKQSVETLTRLGAVDSRGNVAIDTGAVIFSPNMCEDLYKLVEDEKGEEFYINPVTRLSLYGDFLYPLASASTLEDFYKEKPEGEFCEELRKARTAVWNTLRPYRLKLLSLAPAKFIHFGTTHEVVSLMDSGVSEYGSLGWSRKVNSSITDPNVAGYNSVMEAGAEVGRGTYLEVSYVHDGAKIGEGSLISFLDIYDETVPAGAALHGLKQLDGKFVCRIYGVDDNPKTGEFFKCDLESILGKISIDAASIWDDGEEHNLWNAKLYPVCSNIKEAVAESLTMYRILMDTVTSGEETESKIKHWLGMPRKSLRSGFNDADPHALIEWSKRMAELVKMNSVAELIRDGRPAEEAKAALGSSKLSKIQKQWLDRELKNANGAKDPLKDFSYRMRLYFYLGSALEDETYTTECFRTIAETILNATIDKLKYNDDIRIATDETVVKLPLRVNFGGGWADTAPHCIEHGGTVINAAITLAGEMPVEARLVKIPEYKIVFDSRDMDVHGEFENIEPLQRTGDPYDPFALQKACLLACGIIPKTGGDLRDILMRLGGGFEMHSEVTDVPKGSGLGTSSILSAACVKAVFEFMGIEHSESDLYETVLAMEQIMSTGGGWQDQVGGVTKGIKFITSKPGINQEIKVEHIQIDEETKKELNERFCLIYTGQRRLARNLLRDVVGRYVGNNPDSIYAHREIQRSAALMRYELERGNVDGFATLLNDHWELSKKLDAGSSNTLIDQIFMTIDDLIDARMVCGAGGGGFLQVILKKGVTKADVHERLKDVFQDFAVDVWDSEIVY